MFYPPDLGGIFVILSIFVSVSLACFIAKKLYQTYVKPPTRKRPGQKADDEDETHDDEHEAEAADEVEEGAPEGSAPAVKRKRKHRRARPTLAAAGVHVTESGNEGVELAASRQITALHTMDQSAMAPAVVRRPSAPGWVLPPPPPALLAARTYRESTVMINNPLNKAA